MSEAVSYGDREISMWLKHSTDRRVRRGRKREREREGGRELREKEREKHCVWQEIVILNVGTYFRNGHSISKMVW